MKQQKRTSFKTTTKRALWFCLGNGVGWVWCSYILAYLGKESIAEKLSQTAVTEIVGVVALYCLKSLFEKRKGFGAVGKSAYPSASAACGESSGERELSSDSDETRFAGLSSEDEGYQKEAEETDREI